MPGSRSSDHRNRGIEETRTKHDGTIKKQAMAARRVGSALFKQFCHVEETYREAVFSARRQKTVGTAAAIRPCQRHNLNSKLLEVTTEPGGVTGDISDWTRCPPVPVVEPGPFDTDSDGGR